MGGSHSPKVNLVRYADDFIITGWTKDMLENEVKPLVEQFLRDRGLQLSPEKTCITHYRTRIRLPRTKPPQIWRQAAHPTFQEKHAQLFGKGAAAYPSASRNQSDRLDPSSQSRHSGLGQLPSSHCGEGDVQAGGMGSCGTVSGVGPNTGTPANAPTGLIQRYWHPLGGKKRVRSRHRRTDARRETALVEVGEPNGDQHPASCENPGRGESARSALACLF